MNYNLNKTAGIIRELRKERGLTQEQMAEILGVAEKTYQGYEQGKRNMSVEHLCGTAEYFGVTIDYLLSGEQASTELAKLTAGLNAEQMEKFYAIAKNLIQTLEWA